MAVSTDRIVAAQAGVILAALVVVYWLDRPVLWVAWATITAVIAGATLVWANR